MFFTNFGFNASDAALVEGLVFWAVIGVAYALSLADRPFTVTVLKPYEWMVLRQASQKSEESQAQALNNTQAEDRTAQSRARQRAAS